MKKANNKLETKFPALSRNEATARAIVSAFLISLDPTVSELADLKCAVSEAVTNAIVHGYGGGAGTVFMKLESNDCREVKIEVRDKGCGIENVEEAMEPLFTTNTDGERSGMGFTVMQTFCDKVKVKSACGKGTKVTLMKKLSDT